MKSKTLLSKLKEPMQKCLLCDKLIKKTLFYEHFLQNQKICGECYYKLAPLEKNFKVNDVKCYGLYAYSSEVRNAILQIKVGGDIELAHHLLDPYRFFLRLIYHNYIIVFAPSSEESNEKRGFNHLQEIFGTLDIKSKDVFKKLKPYKQSDQKYEDRKKIRSIIGFKSIVDPQKKYLIVDDITTSHETLRACISLLKSKGIKHIKCFVLAYNHRD